MTHNIAAQVHYHIRWSGGGALDWESFRTHAEAQKQAEAIVRPDETYLIVKFDESCPQCASLHAALPKTSSA